MELKINVKNWAALSFLVGIIFSIVLGLVAMLDQTIIFVLLLLGAVVGLVNKTKEYWKLAIAYVITTIIIILTFFGQYWVYGQIYNLTFVIPVFLEAFLTGVMLVLSIKSMYAVLKER